MGGEVGGSRIRRWDKSFERSLGRELQVSFARDRNHRSFLELSMIPRRCVRAFGLTGARARAYKTFSRPRRAHPVHAPETTRRNNVFSLARRAVKRDEQGDITRGSRASRRHDVRRRNFRVSHRASTAIVGERKEIGEAI